MKKLNRFLVLLVALSVQISFAQDKTVSGNVSDDSGMPLAGVNIIVQGTASGTQSDFDGNYSIIVDQGSVLTYSYVGYNSVSQKVGSSNRMNITLSEGEALEEVVVTAFGIAREKKALGYAVSEVNSEQIEQRTEGDVARVLSGKASGVAITSSSGTSGSATNVVIRGYSSVNGNNQALFVVDGIPFQSDTNSQGGFNGVGSSRFLDLDPNNIESVNVLKGLAASTLYGAQGKNGVIVITTKSGSLKPKGPSKTEITVNQSYFVNEIASMPDYQNEYGGGFDQSYGVYYSNWGPAFRKEGVDGWGNDPAGVIDENGTVPHPYGNDPVNGSSFLANFLDGNNVLFQTYGDARYDWKAYKSAENFFRSGGISNTNVNVRGASEDLKLSYNVNYGHLEEEGFTPGNNLRRDALSVGGRAELSNKFTVTASLNYADTYMVSPPVGASLGGGDFQWSVFGNVFFTPRSVDLMGLPFEIPENGGSIYYYGSNQIINPRWSVKHSPRSQQTNRIYGRAQFDYKLSDNLNVTYRYGLDWFNERNTGASNKNGVIFDAAIFGFLTTYDIAEINANHYLGLTGTYDLDDEIGLNFTLGATSNRSAFDYQGVNSTGQIVFGIQEHFNYENQEPVAGKGAKNDLGVFGSFDFDFNDYLFVNLSFRNDWVSNLPKETNNKFYPSASVAFIPTDYDENLKSDFLNYLKIRGGYGTSASFPGGYPTVNTVGQSTNVNGGAFGALITNAVSNFQANPDLKPEIVEEFEIGVDTGLFEDAVAINASIYKRETNDMIVGKGLPTSTGFTSTQDNIGEVESDGVEVDIDVNMFKLLPLSVDGLSWNSRVNFTKSESVVTKQDDEQILFGGGQEIGNVAIEGFPLGTIVGGRIERNDDGEYIVNAAGDYNSEFTIAIDDNGNEVPLGTEGARQVNPILGNPEPDFVMNYINSINYKNFTFGFHFQHVSGGDMYSSTIGVLLGRGNVRNDRRETFILNGVSADGSPNTIMINNSQYYFTNILNGPAELSVFDASVIRLQEVSLAYAFPQEFLDKTPFGELSLTFAGYNLWHDAYNTPKEVNFDPNVAGAGIGNARGIDYMNGPSTKRYGVSLKASF
jgi:TonB-linked SusC/RagA family outer membrane protein